MTAINKPGAELSNSETQKSPFEIHFHGRGAIADPNRRPMIGCPGLKVLGGGEIAEAIDIYDGIDGDVIRILSIGDYLAENEKCSHYISLVRRFEAAERRFYEEGADTPQEEEAAADFIRAKDMVGTASISVAADAAAAAEFILYRLKDDDSIVNDSATYNAVEQLCGWVRSYTGFHGSDIGLSLLEFLKEQQNAREADEPDGSLPPLPAGANLASQTPVNVLPAE